jgi:tyrosine-protein kinase Etk/Wzc
MQTPEYPPPQSYMPEDDSLDLKKYLFLILANWYWFLISVFLGLGISWLVNRYTKPVYKVQASMMIKDDVRSGGLSGYEQLMPGMEIYRTQTRVANEMEVLKSYTLTRRALEQLDFDITYVGVGRSGLKESYLYHNCPFYIVPDTTRLNPYGHKIEIEFIDKESYRVKINSGLELEGMGKYDEAFHMPQANFTLYLKDKENFNPEGGYSSYYFILNSINGLTNRYRGKVNIELNDDKRGSVFFLSTSGLNAEQEATYLNKLIEVYMLRGLEQKNETAIKTVEFIDQQLGIIDDSLQVAEMNLQYFRINNNLIDLSTEGRMAYERLERYQRSIAELELKQRYLNYLQKYVQDKNNLNEAVAPATVDISDALLNSLILQLNELLRQKQELIFSVQTSNPRLLMLENNIENARRSIQENIAGLLENNLLGINESKRQLRDTEKELYKLPVTERQLISIQRQYKVNDQIYTYLLQKRAEAAIAKASSVADNKPLDPARADNASRISPNTKMNSMMGLLLGFGIPLAILILLDLLNNKISSRTDVENKTRIPIIAHIGHSESGDIPVFENTRSPLAESFRGLRTNLQYLLRDPEQKVITTTSTISGEGKTFVCLNLAAIFALSGKKTLLVGLDLRKPKIHRVFNLDNDTGVSTYLINKSKFKEIIRPTDISNLFIVPSGPIPPNPAELLGTAEMEKFIKEAREAYDIIILDTPPFGIVTDSLILGHLSDATLFLVRQNYSSKDILSLINEVHEKQEFKNLGIVFNDLKRKGYYRSGYKYYNYHSNYRYGYVYGGEGYYGEK